jgi:hypothetical protein
VDVTTRVCFDDLHEIVVPPCKNTKPISDLALWGLDK